MNDLLKAGDFKRIIKDEYIREVIKILIVTPIDFNSGNIKPILIPIALGHHLIVKYILSKNYALSPKDVDGNSLNCLELAITKGYQNIAFQLLANINNNNNLNISEFDERGMIFSLAVKYLSINDLVNLYKVSYDIANLIYIYIYILYLDIPKREWRKI